MDALGTFSIRFYIAKILEPDYKRQIIHQYQVDTILTLKPLTYGCHWLKCQSID